MENLQLGYILAGMVNFAILYFLFRKFLADSLSAMIIERRKKLKELEGSDVVVREKLEAAQKEADEIIQEAREKAHNIESNADEISKQNAKTTIEAAELKAKNIIEAANRQLEKDEKEMWQKLKDKVLEVSMNVNKKLFNNADKNKDFLESEINSIKM